MFDNSLFLFFFVFVICLVIFASVFCFFYFGDCSLSHWLSDGNFCSRCGEDLRPPHCECGTPVRPNHFCSNCGLYKSE